MTEMEKLQVLLEKTADTPDTPDAQAAGAAANALVENVKSLVSAMPAFLLRGEKPTFDADGARDALAVLNRCGAAWGISFVDAQEERALFAYLMRFARDLLFQDRPSRTDGE